MKETGLMFKAPLVRAILSGHKTQTRHILKNQQTYDLDNCPFGQPGDRIYVCEAFAWVPTACDSDEIVFAADYQDGSDKVAGVRYGSPFRMPKSAARIWLEITGVRVERLQSISEDDCWLEGIEETMACFDDASQCEMAKRLGCCIDDAKPVFALVWESTGGDWDANPWVWVIDFKRIEKP